MCGAGFVGMLCNLFVPTVGLGDRLGMLWSSLQTRFPFSIASQLNISGDGLGGAGPIPAFIGSLPVNIALIHDVSGVVRASVMVLAFFYLVWFLVDRLTPQTTI